MCQTDAFTGFLHVLYGAMQVQHSIARNSCMYVCSCQEKVSETNGYVKTFIKQLTYWETLLSVDIISVSVFSQIEDSSKIIFLISQGKHMYVVTPN